MESGWLSNDRLGVPHRLQWHTTLGVWGAEEAGPSRAAHWTPSRLPAAVFNPKKRITVPEALAHPYLAETNQWFEENLPAQAAGGGGDH